MLSKSQIAVLYMVGSVICFSTMDILVKYLDNFPVAQLLFMRFFFGLIPIFFLIPRKKIFTFYKTKRPILHAFRAISGAVAIIALFIALRNLPLADVISLTFAGPIFVTIFSIIFLSEKVGIKRWSAVFIGFIGMLFIVQPAFVDLNIYYIFPIIFCIGFSFVAISIRSLSKTEPNYLIAFYFTMLVLILSLFTLPMGWNAPSKFELFLFVVLGLAGSELADQIRNQPLVAPQSELEGLNSEAHAFRNVRLQNELLSEARARGLFSATWDCRFDSTGEDDGWIVALAALDEAYCNECRAPTIVVLDGNDDVLARYRARNGAVLIKEDARALAGREPVDLVVVVDSAVGAAAALRNRARFVVSRGASEVLAALCAELGRGGVVAYKC